MKTIKDLRLSAALGILEEFQAQLRQRLKYGDTQDTTWDEVRDLYYTIRNEYAHLDLLDYEDED